MTPVFEGVGIALESLRANKVRAALTILGVAFPPVASIMVVDYFVLRTHRRELQATRSTGLPAWCPKWNLAGWLAWIAASLVGYYVHWGIASINALVVGAALYYVLAKILPVQAAAVAASEA